MEQTQTQVLSRARPIRFAFFVALDEASHPVLDAIFSYAFSIWGGRFSLIVPFVNGEPHPAYVPWLKEFDPDFIYSYVNLTPEKQIHFHESIYPSSLQHHWKAEDDEHTNVRPSPSVSPLTVDTLLPLASVPSALDGVHRARLLGAMGKMERDRFISDSFGFAPTRLRNLMRNHLSESGSMLYVIPEDEMQPRQRYISSNDTTVPDVNSLLNTMATDGRIIGVAQLSALLTPRLSLGDHRWSESFNIVVGDTVEDRIFYWNSRAKMPAWRDGSNVDLCIPRLNFDDPLFVNALRDFMRRRNHVSGDAGGGQNRATLRSLSLSQEDLSLLTERMKSDQSWITYNYENITSIADCVPDARILEHAALLLGQHGWRSQNLWRESFSAGNELRLTSPEPEHMRHVPTALVSPSSGAWAVDMDVERALDHSPYSNVRHRWRLPRRLRVTSAFLQDYQITEPHGEIFVPRVSGGGLLTIFTAANVALPKINLPEDYDAIVTGLQRGRDWLPFDRYSNAENRLPQLCCRSRKSDAGLHFWGVYQLFGGVNVARSFLMHEFWRRQLGDYQATDQRTDVRHEIMQIKLARRIGSRAIDLRNDSQMRTLSDIVLQEADSIRTNVRSLSWAKFKADFEALSIRYDERNPSRQSEEDLAKEPLWRIESLRESVQSLCQLGVLHQGYENKCRKCLHRSWIAINDLKAQIACEVCGDIRLAPVDSPWQFRLNGFLRESLQRHGVGPLFWVLGRLQRYNASSFWFEGPLNIYFDQTADNLGEPDTDIDLTMIDNGLVRMCEVKQSERNFTDPAELAKTMAKLRPDIAMIAVMEEDSPALQKKYSVFCDALEGTGVKPELLVLDVESDISDEPFF